MHQGGAQVGAEGPGSELARFSTSRLSLLCIFKHVDENLNVELPIDDVNDDNASKKIK